VSENKAADGEAATKRSSGRRLPTTKSINVRMYFCLTRVASVAAAAAAAAAAEESVNKFTGHLGQHTVISSGSALPSLSTLTVEDVRVAFCHTHRKLSE